MISVFFHSFTFIFTDIFYGMCLLILPLLCFTGFSNLLVGPLKSSLYGLSMRWNCCLLPVTCFDFVDDVCFCRWWGCSRKLAWVGFKPTTTEFRSDTLTNWAIKLWVELPFKNKFEQLLQFHLLFRVQISFQIPSSVALSTSIEILHR